MWCLTCGLDTVTLSDVTAALTDPVTIDKLAEAGELAGWAHLAHDGAHEPNWQPGDPMDDITAVHYHLTIGPDAENGGTRMPVGITESDQCFGDDFRAPVARLVRALVDLADLSPACSDGAEALCRRGDCVGCTVYRQIVSVEKKLGDVPEALLTETGYGYMIFFGGDTVVRAGVTCVEASACRGTTG